MSNKRAPITIDAVLAWLRSDEGGEPDSDWLRVAGDAVERLCKRVKDLEYAYAEVRAIAIDWSAGHTGKVLDRIAEMDAKLLESK